MSDVQGVAILALILLGCFGGMIGFISLLTAAENGSRSAVLTLWSIAATVFVLLVLAACGVFG